MDSSDNSDNDSPSPFAKTPVQQISSLKKSVSQLKAELICNKELNEQLKTQVKNLQNELKIEKHERGSLEEKYTKLREKSVKLGVDFKEFCKNLRTHLNARPSKQSSESVPFASMMELQTQMDNLVASVDDGESFSDIRRGIRENITLMEEMVELIDSMEEVTSTTASLQTKTPKGKPNAQSGTWICAICSNSFSDHEIFANHQNGCRLESPSTSKQLSASLSKNAGIPIPTTSASAKANATAVMGPPSNAKRATPNQNANFCKLARRFAKSSSSKFATPSLMSVVAVTVVEPAKIFLAAKHHRDITKRHIGCFCYCGMKFTTRNGLDQHRVFQIKSAKKPKVAVLRKAMKKEKKD